MRFKLGIIFKSCTSVVMIFFAGLGMALAEPMDEPIARYLIGWMVFSESQIIAQYDFSNSGTVEFETMKPIIRRIDPEGKCLERVDIKTESYYLEQCHPVYIVKDGPPMLIHRPGEKWRPNK